MIENLGTCEFCGKENIPVESTSMVGPYCEDCLRLTVEECKAALKKLKNKKSNKKSNITAAELAELEKAKDEALAKLMKGEYK